MMSSSLTLPRTGHFEQLYHIYLYSKKHHNTEMVFAPSKPTINEELFENEDWSNSVYATDNTDLKEALPGNIPEPPDKGTTMGAYVDVNHAGDSVTSRSRTGFLIYLNSALMYWHSKNQMSA